jgi:aryl-alcohol dehydrogenase-like predicted oxidoreductase
MACNSRGDRPQGQAGSRVSRLAPRASGLRPKRARRPRRVVGTDDLREISSAPMKRVALGRSGIEVSEVFLGCGSIGGIGSALATLGKGLTDGEAFDMMDRAVAIGINVLDTANSYGGGQSERVVGRWLAERQSDVLVATKVGNPVEPGQEDIDLSGRHIHRQLPASLERLSRSHVDLYLSHAPDDRVPIAETLEAFAALIEGGRVRAIGACNVSAGQLEEALAEADRLGLPRYEWVQNEYNLLARADESGVLTICREHGLGYTPHSPLCGGILSGKYQAGSPRHRDRGWQSVRVATKPTCRPRRSAGCSGWRPRQQSSA